MSTANEIVTDAFRNLTLIDINETAPSPAEMTAGLRKLSQMIDAWVGVGLSIADVTGQTATIVSGSAQLSNIASTAKMARGMNIAGTGIPPGARILTVDEATKVTLDSTSTASGTAVALTITALPFEQKHERGVAALLAIDIAAMMGEDSIPAAVVAAAKSGWTALQAQFMPVPTATFDAMLTRTTSQTRQFLSSTTLDGN